jgi:hypothetical protein
MIGSEVSLWPVYSPLLYDDEAVRRRPMARPVPGEKSSAMRFGAEVDCPVSCFRAIRREDKCRVCEDQDQVSSARAGIDLIASCARP